MLSNVKLFVTSPKLKTKLSKMLGNDHHHQKQGSELGKRLAQTNHVNGEDDDNDLPKCITGGNSSSDDEAILYNPQKMLENRNDKFYMTFSGAATTEGKYRHMQ